MYNGENNIALQDDSKKFVKSVNVNGIELIGPSALYFANKTEDTLQNIFEISEFTFLLMAKFTQPAGTTSKNTLFEILCNTLSSSDSASAHPTYGSQVISINLENPNQANVNAEVRIGKDTHKQTIAFQSTVFYSDTPVLIALSYNKTSGSVKLSVGSEVYSFAITNPDTITLGSAPFILNKGGEINMNIYSMAFYKKALTTAEINQYKQFNNYYIDGNSQLVAMSQATASQLAEATTKLQNVQSSLSNCEKTVTTATPVAASAAAASAAAASTTNTTTLLPMNYAELIYLSDY